MRVFSKLGDKVMLHVMDKTDSFFKKTHRFNSI